VSFELREGAAMMKKVTIALIGAGQRGMDCYATYALRYPYEVQFVAVAEPKRERREAFQRAHKLPAERCFADWRDLLAQPKLADAVMVCTLDKLHFEPVMAALQAGYHLFVEKPLSPDPDECVQMGRAAEQANRVFLVGHVLRYTNFFATIKQILEADGIGRLISIQHNENIAFWHYAHSYVRGNWRNSHESSPIILAKSCHDMDILLWLAGADCTSLSSFGSLTHFTRENAPEGAPDRCLDGCPVAQTCLYYAPRFYLTGQTGWPVSVISDDPGADAVLEALQKGPYGRCVYHCDNNVVDHQVVNIEFANGVTAAFTMCAFTNDVRRTIKLMGTKGELHGVISENKNEIKILEFRTQTRKVIELANEGGANGHGGGDFGLMRSFVELVRNDGQQKGLTSAATSVQSHLMAFAAEKSRVERKVVDLHEFADRPTHPI
jgi:predicted dehydrogenase